jgi:hypothetical protein
MNIICVATEETQDRKYLYQFLFFEFLSLLGKMDSLLRMPCGIVVTIETLVVFLSTFETS